MGGQRTRAVQPAGSVLTRLSLRLLHQLLCLSEPRCTPDSARQRARPTEGSKAVLLVVGLPHQPSLPFVGTLASYREAQWALCGWLPAEQTHTPLEVFRQSPSMLPHQAGVSPGHLLSGSGPTGGLSWRREVCWLCREPSQGVRHPSAQTGSHQPTEEELQAAAGIRRCLPSRRLRDGEGWRGPCASCPTRGANEQNSALPPTLSQGCSPKGR